MSTKKEPNSLPRRDFLKVAGLASGALGAVAASLYSEPAKAEAADDARRASGYRETEHVRTYYQLARF